MKLNIVPARTGIQWVKLGLRTFFRQPLALGGLFFMCMSAALVIAVVPVVGRIVALLLVPAATLGLLVAAEHASQGRFPMPSVLLSAFRAGKPQARAMLVLGAVYALAAVAISQLMPAAVMDGSALNAPGSATPPQVEVRPGLLVGLLLELPLAVFFTQAPALVYWHGLSAGKSLFFSAVAFWRNLGAFVVFGATWLVVVFAVALLVTLMFAVFGPASTAFALPILLLVTATMATSMYFPFRDCFVPKPEDPTDPAPT